MNEQTTGKPVVFDMPLGVYWFDSEGILHVRAKSTPRTLVNTRENCDFVRRIAQNKKVCLLADLTDRPPFDKECRDLAIREAPKLYRAIAMIPGSPLGNVIANIFMMLKPPSLPAKKFTTEDAARTWLRRYLVESPYFS